MTRAFPMGTRQVTNDGYIRVRVGQFHPLADKKGWVREHRMVASETLGRLILRSEDVHHINGDKLDNRPENLEVLSPSEHQQRHRVAQLTDAEVRELRMLGVPVARIMQARVGTHTIARVGAELKAAGFPRWCRKGLHLLVGTNVYHDPDGNRSCRACWRKKNGHMPREVRMRLRTHCKWGHEYTAENTRIDTRGARTCRVCQRERSRRHYARA